MKLWEKRIFSPAGAAASAAVLFLLSISDLWLQKQQLVGADFSFIHLPYRLFFAETLRAGSFPFWSKELGGGFPILAQGEGSFFYPLTILFLFFSPHTAYLLSCVLSLSVHALLLFSFFRILLSPASSFCLSLLLAFGQIANLGLLDIWQTLSWAPLLFLAVHKLFVSSKPRLWGSLLAISLALTLFSGHGQLFFLSALSALLFALFKITERRLSWQRLLTLFCAFPLAIAILSPQLFPSRELLRLSVRAGGHPDVAVALTASLSPLLALLLFLLSVLFPFVVFRKAEKRRLFRALALLNLFALLLALGRHSPLYLYLFRNVPPFTQFSTPMLILDVAALTILPVTLALFQHGIRHFSISSPPLLSFMLFFVGLFFWTRIQLPPYRDLPWEELVMEDVTPTKWVGKLVRTDADRLTEKPAFLEALGAPPTPKNFFRIASARTTPFRPNLPLLFGFSTLNIYSPLALASWGKLMRLPPKILFRLFGVRFFVVPPGTLLPDLTLFFRGKVWIYKVDSPFPRAYLSAARFFPSGETLMEELRRGNFSQTLALTTHPQLRLLQEKAAEGEIKAILESPNRVALQVKTESKTLLVLNEMNYPGWEARSARKRLPLFTVNGGQIATLVPAGVHKVIFAFSPLHFPLYFGLSVLSLLLLLLFFAADLRGGTPT